MKQKKLSSRIKEWWNSLNSDAKAILIGSLFGGFSVGLVDGLYRANKEKEIRKNSLTLGYMMGYTDGQGSAYQHSLAINSVIKNNNNNNH